MISVPRFSLPGSDRRRLPPGPEELPVVGQTFRYLRDPIGLMEESAAYGDLVTMSKRPWLVYMLNHPDLIREVFVNNHRIMGRWRNVEAMRYLMGNGLVTSEDPLHDRHRQKMQPAFRHHQIERISENLVQITARHMQDWHETGRIDMSREMRELTLKLVTASLFDVDVSQEVGRIGEAFESANHYMSARFTQLEMLRPILHGLPLPSSLRFKRHLRYLDEVVHEMMEQRSRDSVPGDNLLSLLLESEEDGATSGEAPLTSREVRDELMTIFAVGHETVAVGLTWTWYLLATHPDIQDRFHAELDQVLGNRPPTMSDLSSLTFTDQILTESMRLYPPIWRIGRVALEPMMLAGYRIPAGGMICLPQYIIHRDPRWYANPMEFRPERWTREFRRGLHPFAYVPFGAGPRRCIGEGYAWTEAKLVLATIGQRWSFRPELNHKIGFTPLVTLCPTGGMPMFAYGRGKKDGPCRNPASLVS